MSPSSASPPQTGAPRRERGPGMGTAPIPRQPSELRSSHGHGGAEQSSKQCREQGLAPRALPALHPIPIPFQPLPCPPLDPHLLPSSTSQPLQKFRILVLSRGNTLRFPPGNAAMWPTPSRVPPWGPCPALTAAPLAVGQPAPCSRAPQKLGSSLAYQWDPHLAHSRREAAGKTESVPHTSSPFLQPAGMEPPPSPSSPPPSPPPPASQPGTSLFSLRPGWGGGVGGQGKAGSPQPPPR